MKNYLLADKYFLNLKNDNKVTFLSIFPTYEKEDVFRVTYKDLLNRSKKQFVFYNLIYKKINEIISDILDQNNINLDQIIRTILVVLTNIYIDRSLRVIYLISKKNNLFLPKIIPFEEIESLDTLKSFCSSSWHFNQDVFSKIASYFNIKTESNFQINVFPELNNHSMANYTSGAIPSGSILNYIFKNRNSLLKQKISSFGFGLKTMGFSGDDYFFTKNGFYGLFGEFKKIQKFNWISKQRDHNLRNKIEIELNKIISPLMKKLILDITKRKFSDETYEVLAQNFSNFFMYYFPSNFLESMNLNLNRAKEKLKLQSKDKLIGSDFINDYGLIYSTLVKNNGGSIIGVQHGGHYGYIDSLTLNSEIEYSIYDKFFTWGWKKIEDHMSQTETIKIPSPRLSELNKYFKNRNSSKFSYPIKLLVMTNNINRFPHIGMCGQSRIDFIERILNDQINLFKAITMNNLQVYHKPYDTKLMQLFPEHFDKLNQINRKRYDLIIPKHKGFNPKFYDKFDIVLWDQIGTGALECFTIGKPTLIYWRKIYSKDNIYSENYINNLEESGVLHTTTNSLVKELIKFLVKPEDWINNVNRNRSINKFCEKFARVQNDWQNVWKSKLKKI